MRLFSHHLPASWKAARPPHHHEGTRRRFPSEYRSRTVIRCCDLASSEAFCPDHDDGSVSLLLAPAALKSLEKMLWR